MLLPERHYRARSTAGFIYLVIVIVIAVLVGWVVFGAVSNKLDEFTAQFENVTVESFQHVE